MKVSWKTVLTGGHLSYICFSAEFWETTHISMTSKKTPLKEPQVRVFCKWQWLSSIVNTSKRQFSRSPLKWQLWITYPIFKAAVINIFHISGSQCTVDRTTENCHGGPLSFYGALKCVSTHCLDFVNCDVFRYNRQKKALKRDWPAL